MVAGSPTASLRAEDVADRLDEWANQVTAHTQLLRRESHARADALRISVNCVGRRSWPGTRSRCRVYIPPQHRNSSSAGRASGAVPRVASPAGVAESAGSRQPIEGVLQKGQVSRRVALSA